MALPASEDTRADIRNWVDKEGGDHIEIAAVDVATDQYDMVKFGPWCGIADEDALLGAACSIYAKEGIEVDSAEIATGSTFATQGSEVWYNPTTKEYVSTEAAGLFLVGYVMKPTNANGVFSFEKKRYVEIGA